MFWKGNWITSELDGKNTEKCLGSWQYRSQIFFVRALNNLTSKNLIKKVFNKNCLWIIPFIKKNRGWCAQIPLTTALDLRTFLIINNKCQIPSSISHQVASCWPKEDSLPFHYFQPQRLASVDLLDLAALGESGGLLWNRQQNREYRNKTFQNNNDFKMLTSMHGLMFHPEWLCWLKCLNC